MIVDVIRVACDRCSATVMVKEDHDADRSRSGYPEPQWPGDWSTVEIQARDKARYRRGDLCVACAAALITWLTPPKA